MSVLENLISEVNQLISQQAQVAEEGKEPSEFKGLEEKITKFTAEIQGLSDDDKKQYVEILGVWSSQIREISMKINHRMQEIQANIEGVKNQNKAIQGYQYLNNNNNNH